MQPIKALQERIEKSELGQEWIHDPLMNKDIWGLEELGYSKEECHISGYKNLRFEKFSLTWLKMLAKSTIKASVRQKSPISVVYSIVNNLKNLDNFLVNKGFTQPETLNDSLLQQFISEKNSKKRQSTIAYAINLWAEEEWFIVSFIPKKSKLKTPKINTIPEEVLYKIYEKFDLFPAPLERLFRLQLVIGCRIGELLKMPRQCLKKEADKWFLLRWIEKRKHWKFFQIHPLVAELVQEQQKFLDTQIEEELNFDRLFCWLSTGGKDLPESERRDVITGRFVSRGGRFDVEPVYKPKPISLAVIGLWLRNFSEQANLKDKHGNQFQLKSHMFRRTKASIMAYCEAEDEYIAAVLGHGSLDMLPHYRNRSLERLEKEAQAKGYVDLYGGITTFKPRKRRYEKLAEIIETKITTQLGGCHRPSMLGDCQYRYACLPCIHHRVTEEDRPKIEADIECLEKDLEQASSAGQERRITEINRLLGLLKTRLQGLDQLKNIKQGRPNE